MTKSDDGMYRKSKVMSGVERDGMEFLFTEKSFEEDTPSTENAKSKIEEMLKKRKSKVL